MMRHERKRNFRLTTEMNRLKLVGALRGSDLHAVLTRVASSEVWCC